MGGGVTGEKLKKENKPEMAVGGGAASKSIAEVKQETAPADGACRSCACVNFFFTERDERGGPSGYHRRVWQRWVRKKPLLAETLSKLRFVGTS
jgi:hypothetical protein